MATWKGVLRRQSDLRQDPLPQSRRSIWSPLSLRVPRPPPFTGSLRATRYGNPKAGASGSVAGPGLFRQTGMYRVAKQSPRVAGMGRGY